MPTREEIDRLRDFVSKLGDEPRMLTEFDRISGEDESLEFDGIDRELPKLRKEVIDKTGPPIENGRPTSVTSDGSEVVESIESTDFSDIPDAQATEMSSENGTLLSEAGSEAGIEESHLDKVSFDDEVSTGFVDGELSPEDEGPVDSDVELAPDFNGNYDSAAVLENFDNQEESRESNNIKSAAKETGDMASDSDSGASADSDFGEELILDEEISSTDRISGVSSESATVQENGDESEYSLGDFGEELILDEEISSTDRISGVSSESATAQENGDESEYSLGDFGDDYDFSSESDTVSTGVVLGQTEIRSPGAQDENLPFPLKEDHYIAIQQTLAGLPRNLKLAIEETLADERVAPKVLQPLIDALIKGANPRSLVNSLWRITKRKIELPRGYEKLSGRLLVQKRRSLSYRLMREGWPIVRSILLVVFITWVFGAAAFMWIYRPLMAEHIYDMGLEAIHDDDVDSAISHFYDAWYGWPLFARGGVDRIADSPVVVKGWKNKQKWLEYAMAFRARRYWETTERFYEGYLEFKPDDKSVRLKYANYLSGVMGKHEKAIAILEEAPSTGKWDREYTLAAGDIYLDWAQDDPTKYEEARFRYAKALETFRNDERVYLSMMNYHLQQFNEKEISLLLPVFEKEVPGKTDAPELAAVVYAGLAEHFLARSNNRDSRRFIELARAADPLAPEPAFINAVYWRLVGDEEREYQAYKTTLANLDARESFSRNDLRMRILTLGGVGRIQAANGASRTAMVSYNKALKLFEDAHARNQLGASPEYGQLYLEQGKIMYQGFNSSNDLVLSLAENQEPLVEEDSRYVELTQAEKYFNMAEEIFDSGTGGGLPPEILYRRAYVRYVLGLEGALLDFHRVARYEPADYEARLALATALLVNGDFEASRSQYVKALELLDEELREFEDILNPAEEQKHAELLIRYVLIWNNLGVSRIHSALRGGGDSDYAEALSAFTMASTYLDEVDSSMQALNARGLTGVRGSKQERIVSVQDGRRLLLDKTTYPYVNRLRLLGIGIDDKFEAGKTHYLFYPDIPSSLQS